MNRRWTLAAIGTPLLAALLLAGCASPPAGPSAPIKLTILHTNDHHGRFWPNGDGEYGMAARKTLIDRVRAEVTSPPPRGSFCYYSAPTRRAAPGSFRARRVPSPRIA